MIRFSKGALLSAAALMISAGATFATTWNVPGNFSTIQAAINSSSVRDGDALQITASLTDNGFNCTKRLTIYSPTQYQWIRENGLIQVSSYVIFRNLYIYTYTNGNLIRTNAGKANGIEVYGCVLYGGGSSSNFIIDDYGIGGDGTGSNGVGGLNFYNTTLTGAGEGIDGYNAHNVYTSGCNFQWNSKGIYYRSYVSGNDNSMAVDGTTFTSNYTSYGYSAQTLFPNVSGYDQVRYYNSYFTAGGTGSVPIILAGKTYAYIQNNTFYNCPTGVDWTKTSTDIISASGNTDYSGSNCHPGSY